VQKDKTEYSQVSAINSNSNLRIYSPFIGIRRYRLVYRQTVVVRALQFEW